MKEYIEYEAVIETLRKLYNEPEEQHKEKNYYVGICAVAGELALIPDADVAPVRHGKWIACCDEPHLTRTSAGASKFWFTCSICGRKELHKEPYCHCGAKMEEVK